jgi:hypothetical protein
LCKRIVGDVSSQDRKLEHGEGLGLQADFIEYKPRKADGLWSGHRWLLDSQRFFTDELMNTTGLVSHYSLCTRPLAGRCSQQRQKKPCRERTLAVAGMAKPVALE